MKAHQRSERAFVERGRIVRRVEQLPMQVAVDDAGCELRSLGDVRPQHLQTGLFRKRLRYGHDGHQDDSGGERYSPEYSQRELTKIADHCGQGGRRPVPGQVMVALSQGVLHMQRGARVTGE